MDFVPHFFNHAAMCSPDPYHYKVVERAIHLIDAAKTKPSLTELAAQLQMSPAHFQRVFSEWAGVSPKKLIQFLTLENAKQMLAQSASLSETTNALDLSSSSRLHDTFIRWEAMTPGDYAKKGAGLTISWGWHDTPFGPALLMATARGLCGLGFVTQTGAQAAFDDLAGRWPKANFVEHPQATSPYLDSFLAKRPTKLHLIGASLQIKVWEALLHIPEGGVTTYSDIANAIDNPRAVRAVGTAIGRNPVSWLVPCHRVLRQTGALGGYHWGLPVKRALLAHERAAHWDELSETG